MFGEPKAFRGEKATTKHLKYDWSEVDFPKPLSQHDSGF